MTAIDTRPTPMTKAEYVLAQQQTRPHHCHWPGCTRSAPPARWGCRAHWFTLPLKLRQAIWATYRPGQEKDGSPSKGYLRVASEVQDWISTELQRQAAEAAQQPTQQDLL